MNQNEIEEVMPPQNQSSTELADFDDMMLPPQDQRPALMFRAEA
jgi:hypothetical protein